MPQPRVYIFIDNSNIFVSAKENAETREGRAARDLVRLHFKNLVRLAHADREIAKIVVAGSVPPDEQALWDRLAEAAGVKPELYERGNISGGEQGIDQCLQVHMLRAAHDAMPQVAVLLTGDGAGFDDGVGFHADMSRMHANGWGVEVVSWDRNCRRALKNWAASNGCYIRLDDYYDAITFIEGGRRAQGLDLSSRPTATNRMSPVERARAEEQSAAKLREADLQRQLDELRTTVEKKQRKREKYNNKMKVRQGKL